MRGHLGLLLTAEMGALELPEPPRQERLQEVQRSTFQKGRDEPSMSSEDSEKGKVGQVRVGHGSGPREYGMEMKGLQGNGIKWRFSVASGSQWASGESRPDDL